MCKLLPKMRLHPNPSASRSISENHIAHVKIRSSALVYFLRVSESRRKSTSVRNEGMLWANHAAGQLPIPITIVKKLVENFGDPCKVPKMAKKQISKSGILDETSINRKRAKMYVQWCIWEIPEMATSFKKSPKRLKTQKFETFRKIL